MRRIVDEPDKVRAELERVGGPGATGQKDAKWALANKILQTEKAENRAAGISLNYGRSGLGTQRLKQIVRDLEDYDITVRDARRALGKNNRSTYTSDGQQTPRRHLAETIITVKEREVAHRHGHLHPRVPRRVGVVPSEELVT